MTLSAAECEYVCKLVRQRAGIVLDEQKAYLVETRLEPLARQSGFPSIQGLLTHSQANPHSGLRERVVEALTTNETSFYRDVKPFDALRQVVLPDLIRKRAAERRLTVWCAASSTGQEPYTLAMLIREHFPELAGWQVRMTATDISTEVLARAREGRYSQIEVNRGLPVALLARYFRRVGAEWQLSEDVRRMVEFRPLNLIERWPDLGRPDLILLRNVLIYFDVPTKKDILARARQILRPDGYLMLGGAESTLHLDDEFERVEFERAGLYRLRTPMRRLP